MANQSGNPKQPLALSKIMRQVYEAMTPGKWYDALLDGLPLATGHTYAALERRGLIRSKRVSTSSRYTPKIWSHQFMRIPAATASSKAVTNTANQEQTNG